MFTSTLRRVLVVAVAAMAALVTLVPLTAASPAAAAPGEVWAVTMNGKYSIVDDDSSIFGSSFSNASNSFTKTFFVNSAEPTFYSEPIWSACAGGEVNGDVRPYVRYGTNAVYVSMTMRLHEGSSCKSDDVDGFTQWGEGTFFNGMSQTFTIKTRNDFEGGLDSSTLTFTLTANRV